MTETNSVAEDWTAVATAWEDAAENTESKVVAPTEALIDAVAVRPGERVLELAAGPGALGARWSEAVGPSGTVLLSDIAPGMVEAARRRTASLANVDVAVIDASDIDRPDNSFDVVVCRMGLMFTPEPAAAFAEIARVLAPGGRFGALTWGAPQHNPWITCVGMAAMTNGLVSGGPPVGPGGIFSLGDPADLEALAKGAGFVDVAVAEHPALFEAATIEEHVTRVSSLAGQLAAVFASATPEQLEAVTRTAAALAADYITADGVRIPGRANLVTGRV